MRKVKTKRFGLTVYQIARKKGGKVKYTRSWYFKPQKDGIRTQFPLGADKETACQLADEIYIFLSHPENTMEATIKKYGPKKATKATYPTIGQYVALFERHRKSLEVNPKSFENYRYMLRYICKRVLAFRAGKPYESQSGRKVDYRDVDGLRVDWLDVSVIQDIKAAFLEDTEDEEEELTAKISCNSMIRAARALFNEQAMDLYKQNFRVPVDAIQSFNSVKPFKKAQKYFQLLPYSTIRRILIDSEELMLSRRSVYLAFILGIHAGLRRGEIAHAKLDWFQVSPNRVQILVNTSGGFNPKHGTGRTINVERFLYDRITALVDPEAPYILPGDYSARYESVFIALNEWLRSCGVNVPKPTHELRKLWISAKVKIEGLLAAQQQAGHRDPKVTSQHYADNQMDEALIPYWLNGKLVA